MNSKPVFVIVVGVDVHTYGPFPTHKDANNWLGNGNAFAGRKVFIQTMEPINVHLS